MFRSILFTLTFAFSLPIFAQTEAQLERLSKATCGCMANKDVDKMDGNAIQTEVGVCMLGIVAKDPEAKTLMAFMQDAEKGKAFGEKIGAKLAKYCPDLVMKMAAKMDPSALQNGNVAADQPTQMSVATVKEVRIGELVTFITTDEKGRELKLTWLESFDGDATLMENPATLKGKKAEFSFKTFDRYDPRLKEYVPIKVVTAVKML